MRVLYVLFVLDTLSLAVYLPVFSAFVRALGGSPFTLGLINSSHAFITLFLNLIVGSLSDQIGRKALLWRCMIASSVGSLILCFSSSSLTLVFLGRIVAAFGSPVLTLLRSTVADVFKTDEEKKLFLNKCAPLISLAFLVGSLSSGFLSEAKNGFSLAFLLMAFITGSASYITQKHLPTITVKSEEQIKDTSSFIKKSIQELKSAAINLRSISWPRYKDIFYIKGFYDLSMASVFANVGFIVNQEFNAKGRTVGYIFLMISLCRIVSTVLKLKLKNLLAEVPDYRRIFFGGMILLMSYFGMAISMSLPGFLVFMGILCIIRPFMDTTLTEVITMKTTESDRGKVMAAYDNMWPFALFVSPVISGLVAEAFGQRILLLLAALPVSVSVYIACKQGRQEVKTEVKTD